MKTLTPFTVAAVLLAAASLAQAESVTYAVEPMHTYVTFEARHFGTSTNRGRFDKKEGAITLDRAARTGRADITIDTASISSGLALFDSHLRGDNFLRVKEFPSAKFTGDQFSFDGDKVSAVSGTLTLLGKTQPITLNAQNFNCYENPMLKREVCGGDFDAVVDRSLYGMTWGMQYGFSKDVHLVIQVEAIKQ